MRCWGLRTDRPWSNFSSIKQNFFQVGSQGRESQGVGREQTREQFLFAHLSGLQEMKEGMSYGLLGSYGFPFGAIKVRREQGHARQRGLVAVEDKEDVLLARALIGINASIMMRTA